VRKGFKNQLLPAPPAMEAVKNLKKKKKKPCTVNASFFVA